MKESYYTRISGTALAVLDLVKPIPGFIDKAGDAWIITRINVPKHLRKMGHARYLLRQCLEDADREGIKLCLEVSPSDGLTAGQLTSWYKRHGFVELHRGVMLRQPVTEGVQTP